MKQSKNLLERLATFKDLSAEEQAEILREAAHDASLREQLEEVRRLDALLEQLSQPKPSPELRTAFYQEMEARREGARPSLTAGLGRLMAAGGRLAGATAAFVLLAALALFFREQLIATGRPQPGAVGRQEATAMPTAQAAGATGASAEDVLGAPATASFAPYPYPPLEPTATPTAYPYPGMETTAVATETPGATLYEPAPIFGPALMRPVDWSPDGVYLTFWQHEAEDYEENPQRPAGTFSFYRSEDGEICTYPRSLYDGTGGVQKRHSWLAAGRLLIFNDDGSYAIGDPCRDALQQSSASAPWPVEEIVAESHSAGRLLLLAEDSYYLAAVDGETLQFTPLQAIAATPTDAAAFSEDSSLLAINSSGGGTSIIDVASGDLLQTFEWSSSGGLGDIFPPQWLDEGTILVQTSAEQGPLLLSLDGAIEPAAALFNLEPSPSQAAEGAPLPGGGYAVALFYLMGAEEYEEGVWYYNSLGRSQQTLPQQRAAFSANGERLILFVEGAGPGEPYEVWWAATEMDRLSPDLLYAGVESAYVSLPQDASAAAIVAGNQLITVDGKGQLATYELTDVLYGGVPIWSPDGAFVATAGGYSGRQESLLYVIPAR